MGTALVQTDASRLLAKAAAKAEAAATEQRQRRQARRGGGGGGEEVGGAAGMAPGEERGHMQGAMADAQFVLSGAWTPASYQDDHMLSLSS